LVLDCYSIICCQIGREIARVGVVGLALMSRGNFSEGDRMLVREQLARMLESTPFVQSPRRQRFLEYVVHETLAGRGERLKGYSIALEVFGRPETFDPVADPIVRIEAGRLREKLRRYYDTDGWNDPVRIELPRGTYMPRIMFCDADSIAPHRSDAACYAKAERAEDRGGG
jgi:hypothetical protein